MQDRDGGWEVEPYDGADEAGVFWPVLRNVGLLVVMALAVAWIFSAIGGGSDASKPGGAQQGRQLSAMNKPLQPAGDGGYELTVPAGANGHYVVNAMANGSKVRFLIDTGASGILLTQSDAQKAGIHPASLAYDDRVQTANGDISVARTTVREIRIAGLIVNDMDVWVTRSPMPISLLGMTFLNRLGSFEARSDRLILRW